MRIRHLTATCATALVLLATGCANDRTTVGSADGANPPPPIADLTEEPATDDPGPGDSAEDTNWTSFINGLDAIDPDIVHGDSEQAVDRARDLCEAIKKTPSDRARLIEATNERFTSPDHPDGHGPGTASKILNAVQRYACPKF